MSKSDTPKTIGQFYDFVDASDVSKGMPWKDRERIALLGLVSEIGSVLSALKKDFLTPTTVSALPPDRFVVRRELKEEIGDALWYVVMLANLYRDDPRHADIFSADIAMLREQLKSKKHDDRRIQDKLTPEKVANFLSAAAKYQDKHQRSLDDYQETAFITARTTGIELRDVCTAVLQQLSAQLTRQLLPEVEVILNREVYPKDPLDALGEIVWHLSALAEVFELKLSEIVSLTADKAHFRNVAGLTDVRHDEDFPEQERLPRRFVVEFREVSPGKSLISRLDNDTWEPIGDTLTDNYSVNDGYRFHDVMHLAFIAFLGWSPVFRKFLKRKRSDDPDTGFIESDEDGGRPKVLEESLILQIHTYAERIKTFLDSESYTHHSVYNIDSALSFEFLRDLHEQTRGYEVYRNPKQDWENAIRYGYDMFETVRQNDGGVVTVDVDAEPSDRLVFANLPKQDRAED